MENFNYANGLQIIPSTRITKTYISSVLPIMNTFADKDLFMLGVIENELNLIGQLIQGCL